MPVSSEPLIELPLVVRGQAADSEIQQQPLVPSVAAQHDKNSLWHDFKNISHLAVPMALSYTFSWSVFALGPLVSHLKNDSEKREAATALMQVMMNTDIFIAISPLFAVSIIASKKVGKLERAQKSNAEPIVLERKRKRIAAINKAGMVIAGVITPLAILPLACSRELLAVFRQKSAYTASFFLRPLAGMVPASMFRMVFEGLMFGFGYTKPAMIIGLIDFFIEMLLAVWLGRGGAGVTGLGVLGIAIAFVCEAYLTAVLFALYIAKEKRFSVFPFFHLQNTTWNQVKSLIGKILNLGAPISFNLINEMAVTFILSLLAGIVSEEDQALLTTALQPFFILFIWFAAFGQSCCQEVNRKIGERDYRAANRLGINGFIITMIYNLPPCLAIMITPAIPLKILGTHQINARKAEQIARVIAATIPLKAMNYYFLQGLRVLSDVKGSTVVSLAGFWLTIALAAMSLITKTGIYGILAADLIGVIFSAAGLGIRWINRIPSQKTQEINENPPEEVTWGQYLCSFFSKPDSRGSVRTDEHFHRISSVASHA